SLNRNLPLSAIMKPVPKRQDSKSKQVNSRSQPTAAHWASMKQTASSNWFPAKKTGFLSVPRWQVQELQMSSPNSALLLRLAWLEKRFPLQSLRIRRWVKFQWRLQMSSLANRYTLCNRKIINQASFHKGAFYHTGVMNRWQKNTVIQSM